MALKQLLKSLDEVPEAIREHYVKDGDGFKLTVDGEGDDLGKIKGALSKERERAQELERSLAELKRSMGDLDPAKAREALAKVQELEDKKLLDEGKIEEVILARTERMRDDWTAKETAFQKELKEARDKVAANENQLSELIVDGALRSVATSVKRTLLPSFIRSAKSGDIDGIRWELRDGKPVPLVGDTVKYGKDPSQPMTPEEYLEVVKTKAPDFFESNTGGAAPGSGNRPTSKHVLTREQAADLNIYKAAKEAAAKDGATVQILAG
jgi:hypothetical protein